MKRKLAIILVLFIVINLSFGADEVQDLKKDELVTIGDCVKFAKNVGDHVQNGSDEAAFDLLHSEEYFIRDDFTSSQRRAALANFQAVSDEIKTTLGAPIFDGFEFIKVTKAGDSHLSVYFWGKYRYAPVPWRFSFYKPNDIWKLYDFSLGTQAVPEIILISEPVDIKN